MATGTVKWFRTDKGYGFIQPDTGRGDVFVHKTALERSCLPTLQPGDRVHYELVTDQRSGKLAADHLKLVARSGS